MMIYAKCVVKAKSFVPKTKFKFKLDQNDNSQATDCEFAPLLIAMKAHGNKSSFSVIYIILIVEKVISLNIWKMPR